MATDNKIEHLQPAFQAKVRLWLNDVAAEGNSSTGPLAGIEFIVIETLRPWERQAELYAQGRTKPGPIVTKAEPGESLHQFALALDGGPKYKGKPFSWTWDQDPKLMAAMRRIAALAKKRGIDWGFALWGWDLPHFQESPTPSLKSLRAKYPRGWRV